MEAWKSSISTLSSTPMANTPYDDEQWIPKLEAAALLGISERQLRNLAGVYPVLQNRIENARGVQRSMYSVNGLKAYLAAKAGAAAALEKGDGQRDELAMREANIAPQQEGHNAWREEACRRLVSFLLPRLAPSAPAHVRRWLTLEEASQRMNLPESLILARLRAGELPYLYDGKPGKRPRKSGYRFHPEDLARVFAAQGVRARE